LEKFNQRLISKNIISDFSSSSKFYGGGYVKSSIDRMFKSLSRQVKYFADGNRVERGFFDAIYHNLDMDSIDRRVRSRFALTVKYTNQKLVPVELALLRARGEIYFDRNQTSH